MKLAAALLLVAGCANAFTRPVSFTTHTRFAMSEVAEAVEAEAEVEAAPAEPESVCLSKAEILSSPNTIEFANFWDPLGLSDQGSDETIAWFRHAEIKHGRVAMAAFVGWWAVSAGLHFPGNLATDMPFESLPTNGLEAWAAVPGWGKVQMLGLAGSLELADEFNFSNNGNTHYLKGGIPGKNMVPGFFDPLGLTEGKSPEALARGRDVEIKNGRLAMIGIMGLVAQAQIPGAVPLQPPC